MRLGVSCLSEPLEDHPGSRHARNGGSRVCFIGLTFYNASAATPSAASASPAAKAKAPDAAAVVAQLKAAGIPVIGVYVVTEANDGNNLLVVCR